MVSTKICYTNTQYATPMLFSNISFVSGELSEATRQAAFNALYNQTANAYSGKI